MKKLLSIIITLATLLTAVSGLVSCGGGADFTVGIAQLAPHPALDAATKGFKDALTEELQKVGKTVEFKEQNAGGEISTCPSIVGAFVANGVDLILANATPVLQAAKNATKTIPILGTSDLAPLDEQAQMLIDTLGLTAGAKIGLLYCSAEPNSAYQVRVVKEYLSGKGMVCTEYPFADSNELTSVATKAANDGLAAVYVPTDNTVADNAAIVKNVIIGKGVPVFAGEEGICAGCGYATLSIDYYNLGRKTGEMAAKVLLGQAHIEDMAIAYDANPTKKYNREICEALGIDIAALEAAGYVAIGE